MRRLLVCAAIAAMLCGCSSQSYLCNWCGVDSNDPAAIDPFFGRTRVPPPGTGQHGQQPAPDPYYPGPAAGSAPGAPAYNNGTAPSSRGGQYGAGSVPPANGNGGASSTFAPRTGGATTGAGNGGAGGSSAAGRGSGSAYDSGGNSSSSAGANPSGNYVPRDGRYQYQGTSTLNRLNRPGYTKRSSPFRVQPPSLNSTASAGEPTPATTTASNETGGQAGDNASAKTTPAGPPATSSAVAGAGRPDPQGVRAASASLEDRERIVRTLHPRADKENPRRPGSAPVGRPAHSVETAARRSSAATGVASTGRANATRRREGGVIDIMDLPPAKSR